MIIMRVGQMSMTMAMAMVSISVRSAERWKMALPRCPEMPSRGSR